MRDLLAIDLVEPTLNNLSAEPLIEVDGAHIVVEYPEIRTPLAAPRDPSHRLAQQAPPESTAASLGTDVKIVDVGAEARIALRPDRNEAQVARDQHRIARRHAGELAAPVSLALAVERWPERGVVEDAAIGR